MCGGGEGSLNLLPLPSRSDSERFVRRRRRRRRRMGRSLHPHLLLAAVVVVAQETKGSYTALTKGVWDKNLAPKLLSFLCGLSGCLVATSS